MTKQTERALPATSVPRSVPRSVDRMLLWTYALAGVMLALDLFVWRPL